MKRLDTYDQKQDQSLNSSFQFQKVYCGHEYSIQNLTFGRHVEPDNEIIKEKLAWCKAERAKNPPNPTVPSTIGKYISFNGEYCILNHFSR